MDDVISIVRKGQGQKILDHLNQQHRKIQFTMEKESGGFLPFMDVRFISKDNGRLDRWIYQKPTETNRYIQSDSHQPESVKSNVIGRLTDRAIMVCTEEKLWDAELTRIKEAIVNNEYKPKYACLKSAF